MTPFTLARPDSADKAITEAARDGAAYIAGGTDMLQLLKSGAATPSRLVDIRLPDSDTVGTDAHGLRIGALATMAAIAEDRAVKEGWPAISEALLLSASPQIRNMGTAGGNLLQRTRCAYFRDTGFPCNKRVSGSGCPARAGDHRELAVFGGSTSCIATHPSDLPVALMAMDASVELRGTTGALRMVPLAEFYRPPGDTPQIETIMAPGELITAVIVPRGEAARRSRYVKLRDRTSFAFALVSVAVGLDIRDGVIAGACAAAGGVAPYPWRLHAMEAAMVGQHPTPALLDAAAERALDGAQALPGNAFKLPLLRNAARYALRGVALT